MREVFADTAGWGNYFVRTEPFHMQAKSFMMLWHTDGIRVVTTNYYTLDEEAWALLKEREDKGWSLVDCSSFVAMRHRKILEALTTDPHFEQAGYVCLLK